MNPICQDRPIFPYNIVNAVFKDYFVNKIIKKLCDIGYTNIKFLQEMSPQIKNKDKKVAIPMRSKASHTSREALLVFARISFWFYAVIIFFLGC